MAYFSMIVSFLIVLCLVIAGVQNSIPLQIKIAWWTFQMSIPTVVFWSAVAGGAVVAVLSLPKLVRKGLQTRRLHKEVRRLQGTCKELAHEEGA